jgi:hypothetical protein
VTAPYPHPQEVVTQAGADRAAAEQAADSRNMHELASSQVSEGPYGQDLGQDVSATSTASTFSPDSFGNT